MRAPETVRPADPDRQPDDAEQKVEDHKTHREFEHGRIDSG